MPKNTQQNGDDGNRAAKKRRVTANPTDLVSSTARPSAVEIRRMLPRIASAGLHDVIVNNMLTGRRIGISDLQAAQKARGYVSTSVRPVARDGQDILHDVLSRLNVKERVKCASRICKAWNEMKQRRGLFTDLSDESVPIDGNILDLLHWLPDQALATVTGIRMTGTRIPFREFRKGPHNEGVPTVYHLWLMKGRAKSKVGGQADGLADTVLNDTKKVVLVGREIDPPNLLALTNQGCGPSLKSLALEHLAHEHAKRLVVDPDLSNVFYRSLTDLCSKSKLLEQLKMPAFLVSPLGLLHTLSAVGPVGIQPTALRELDLSISLADPTGTNKDLGTVNWTDIQSLGKYAPNLEVLKLAAVLEKSDDPIPFAPVGSSVEEMVVMQSLRVCVIRRLVPFSGPASSIIDDSKFSYAIGWLLRGMPALEEFTLGHGRMWDLADDSNRFLEEKLPKIGDGLLISCPTSMRKIHFVDIQVDAKCPFFSFSALQTESFAFTNCAGNPIEALAKLIPLIGEDTGRPSLRFEDGVASIFIGWLN